MKTLTPEEFKKRFGSSGVELLQSQPKQQGYGSKVVDAAKSGIEQIKQGFKGATQTTGNPIKGAIEGFENAGKIGAGIVNTVFSPIAPAMDATVGKGVNFAADKISNIPAVQKFADSKAGQITSRVAEDVGNLDTIAGAVAGSKGLMKGIEAAPDLANKVVNKTSNLTSEVIKEGQQLTGKIKQMAEPPSPEPKEAMGQVLQGKSSDITPGFKALKAVDTSKVKTYGDLSAKIKETIKNLSSNVDTVLEKDPKKYSTNDLVLTGKTKLGQPVNVDYVNRALDHLKEMYKSIGDDISAKNIEDLSNEAKTNGLSRKQVNDIARVYGQEFGEKAFGKTGEPLTSVNAQKFENTRKGLKQIARKGLEGSKAEATDKTISNLYHTQKLVDQNVEAVNKLVQKIQERGLLERFGYKAAKVVDILSGGSLRGVMGGLLPRGVGYKVMNALDLQNVLERNLKIIKKAVDTGSDKDLLKIINNLDKNNP